MVFFRGSRLRTHQFTRAIDEECEEALGGNETEDGRTWLSRRFSDGFIDFLDAFSNFAISLRFDQMPASTVVRMLQNSFWSDRPHVPKGGCKGVIDGLRKDLRENGVRVKLSHEITEILPWGCRGVD